MATDKEIVVCRICKTEHTITEAIICPGCHCKIETSVEITARINEISKEIHVLKVEAMGLQAELMLRERRRTLTDVKGRRIPEDNFWKNVYGAPRGSRGAAKKPGRYDKVLDNINLNDFT